LGIVGQDLLVKGGRKEERLNVLFDSSTSRSFIKTNIAQETSILRKLLIQGVHSS